MILCSNPPLPDETMTSWAWRVFNEVDYPSEWIVLHQSFYNLGSCDPDFDFQSPFAIQLQKITQATASELRECFSSSGALIIPRKARSGYCYTCLEESIRLVGRPSWKKSWCSPFIPICQIHQQVLADSLTGESVYYDFPALAFINDARSSDSVYSKILSRYSQCWHGDKYMDMAMRALQWYCNFADPHSNLRSPHYRRLWEVIFIALMSCHAARLGSWKGYLQGQNGRSRSIDRTKKTTVSTPLQEGLYGSVSSRMQALFYCGMVFGVFQIISSEDDVFGYAPMDPLVLGRRVRRDKPEIALWLIAYMMRRQTMLPPATKQFLEGLNLAPGPNDSRFKW